MITIYINNLWLIVLVFYNAKSKGKYNKGNGIVASGEVKDIKENGIMVSVGFKI